MEMINRYISEIGKLLPRKNRADIETEIKSTLEDMLEERMHGNQNQDEQAIIIDLLKEYGSPETVAASYRQKSYLIGPEFYPLFLMVTKIVLIVLSTMAVFGFSIRLGMDAINFTSIVTQLGESLKEYFPAIMMAFGNIVLAFAILERVLPQTAKTTMKEVEDWDPVKYTKEPGPNEVNKKSELESAVFTVLALVLFNLFPQLISIRFLENGSWVSIPILTESFFKMLPWINLTWVLGIILHLLVIHQNRWSLFTYIYEIILKVSGVSIALILLTGPSIISLSAEMLSVLAIPQSVSLILSKIVNIMVVIGLINFIIISLYEIGKILYKLIIKKVVVVQIHI